MDCSPPDSCVQGILQARILEWVTMPSSRGSSWPRDRTCVSCGSCIAGRFLTAEPWGRPTVVNTGGRTGPNQPLFSWRLQSRGKSLQKNSTGNSQQNQPLGAYEVPEGGLGGWCFVVTLLNIHAETDVGVFFCYTTYHSSNFQLKPWGVLPSQKWLTWLWRSIFVLLSQVHVLCDSQQGKYHAATSVTM